MLLQGDSLENLDVRPEDIGCPLPSTREWDAETVMDADIEYREGVGLMGASRLLQRQSENYYILEQVRRRQMENPDKVWDALVLGFIGSGDKKDKKSYAIYLYELGLEWRYSSPTNLSPGDKLKLGVSIIQVRAGQLAFVRK